jgi:hypothetical protein
MRLTIAGAQMYLATSQVSLAWGVLSWGEYLLRLRFVRDSGEPGTTEVRVATDTLQEHDFDGEDDWPCDEPTPSSPQDGQGKSELSISDGRRPFEPPILAFIAAGSTGLHQWRFHQGDPDPFPSVPHGHSQSDARKKLHAYRGWIHREDRQIGREPRWKIIALWNDEKFRSFASAAIHYYVVAFPRHPWPVPDPRRLPRRRRRSV